MGKYTSKETSTPTAQVAPVEEQTPAEQDLVVGTELDPALEPVQDITPEAGGEESMVGDENTQEQLPEGEEPAGANPGQEELEPTDTLGEQQSEEVIPEDLDPATKTDEELDENLDEQDSTIPTPTVEALSTIVYGPEQVAAVLKNGNLTFVEKITEIASFATGEISGIANQLLSYATNMAKARGIVDPQTGVGHNYSLYMLLKSVVDTKDYNEFKVKFDIVNLAFMAFKDDAYDDVRLVRFDANWLWGNVSLTTYIFLVRAIYELANIEDRARNKKTIDINRLFDTNVTSFTAEAKENVIRYYGL